MGSPSTSSARVPQSICCDRGSLMKFARDCDANYLYVFERRTLEVPQALSCYVASGSTASESVTCPYVPAPLACR
jgi:hypothetical protein